jgi:hypothetical protein
MKNKQKVNPNILNQDKPWKTIINSKEINTKELNIYTKEDIIKYKNTAICKIVPDEILKMNIIITRPIQHDSWSPQTKPLIKTDLKRITEILNKLSEENFTQFLEETKTFEYSDPQVVKIIFKKAMNEPFYSELYANFCYKLDKVHKYIKDMCVSEFNNNKNKSLSQFIGHLYKLNIINKLDEFVDILNEDLNDANIEILCKLITIVGPQNSQFNDILKHLDNIKLTLSLKTKFMIMDVIDIKNGKRL